MSVLAVNSFEQVAPPELRTLNVYSLQTEHSSGAFLLITFFFVMKFYHNIAPIDRAQNMWNTYVLQTDCSFVAFCR